MTTTTGAQAAVVINQQSNVCSKVFLRRADSTELEMRGKAQRDSPVLELLAPPGEYGGMIRQLTVRNMISTPNFMDV